VLNLQHVQGGAGSCGCWAGPSPSASLEVQPGCSAAGSGFAGFLWASLVSNLHHSWGRCADCQDLPLAIPGLSRCGAAGRATACLAPAAPWRPGPRADAGRLRLLMLAWPPGERGFMGRYHWCPRPRGLAATPDPRGGSNGLREGWRLLDPALARLDATTPGAGWPFCAMAGLWLADSGGAGVWEFRRASVDRFATAPALCEQLAAASAAALSVRTRSGYRAFRLILRLGVAPAVTAGRSVQ